MEFDLTSDEMAFCDENEDIEEHYCRCNSSLDYDGLVVLWLCFSCNRAYSNLEGPAEEVSWPNDG